MVLVLFKGTRTQKLKLPLKGYCMILKKKMKNFIFQFFDENLLLAWIKDERPQELSWQSALKGYYTILWQKYKNRVFGFFLVKMVFGII